MNIQRVSNQKAKAGYPAWPLFFMPCRGALLLTCLLGLVACEETYPKVTASPDFKVGLVSDTGKVSDGTFDQSAYEGGLRASKDFAVPFDYVESQSIDEFQANIENFVSKSYKMIVTVGFLMENVTQAMAKKFPDTKFAIVDVSYEQASNQLLGLVFAEDQTAFLAGALAGKVSMHKQVGVIGGLNIPPVKRFVQGFVNGLAYTCPECKLSCSYIQSFTAQAKGRAEAERMIRDEHIDVLFAAGGPTGSAAILRAAALGVGVIGVDKDEYYTSFKAGAEPGAEMLLANATKSIDVAVYTAIQKAIDDSYSAGSLRFNLSNNGVALKGFHSSLVSEDQRREIDAIAKEMAAGFIRTGVDADGANTEHPSQECSLIEGT